MLEDLPPDRDIAQSLLDELASDLPYRINRHRMLLAFDADLGGSGVMLPGGEATYRAYLEARAAFVAGNFLTTVVLSQGLIENLLGGHLILDDVFREIHAHAGRASKPLGERPRLEHLLAHASEAGVLTAKDLENINRLVSLRNPLLHFRGIDDPANLTRRAMDSGVCSEEIMFNDARFAISTIISIVRKSQFVIGDNKAAE